MPSVNFTYRGVIVPVFTPFNNDENRSLNLSIIPEYARYLASKNINGVLVNGTTGEGTALSVDERKKVTEAWVAAVKETKQHLMVQVGGTNLRDVKELAAHAEQLCVDSLLCLPELYFKPSTVEDLIQYLQNVGKSAPKTPLLYYHFPGMTNVTVHMGQFLRSVGDRIPTFSGIKFTSTLLDEGYEAAKANSHFTVFLGSDTLMVPGYAAGIDSFITTSLNFIPEYALEILEFIKGKRDLKDAQKNQYLIAKVVQEVTPYGTWVETMKVAMNLTNSLYMGPPRAPLKVLTRAQAACMANGLTKVGLTINKTALTKMYGA